MKTRLMMLLAAAGVALSLATSTATAASSGPTPEDLEKAKNLYPALIKLRDEALKTQADMDDAKTKAKDAKETDKITAQFTKKFDTMRAAWKTEADRVTKKGNNELERLRKEYETAGLRLNEATGKGADTTSLMAEATAINDKITVIQKDLGLTTKIRPAQLDEKKPDPNAKKDDKKKK